MNESSFLVSQDLVSRNNQDGTVILMKMDDSNSFFKINGVAAEIWKGLSKNKTINQIHNEILENYNVDSSTLEKDTENFLNTLIEKKLISKN